VEVPLLQEVVIQWEIGILMEAQEMEDLASTLLHQVSLVFNTLTGVPHSIINVMPLDSLNAHKELGELSVFLVILMVMVSRYRLLKSIFVLTFMFRIVGITAHALPTLLKEPMTALTWHLYHLLSVEHVLQVFNLNQHSETIIVEPAELLLDSYLSLKRAMPLEHAQKHSIEPLPSPMVAMDPLKLPHNMCLYLPHVILLPLLPLLPQHLSIL
jgi:hypothetical protein